MALATACDADLALTFLIFLVLGLLLLLLLLGAATSDNFVMRVVSDLERGLVCLVDDGMVDSVSSVGKDAALLLADFLGFVLGDGDDDDDDVVGKVDNCSKLLVAVVVDCGCSLDVVVDDVLTGRLDLRGLRFFSIIKL